jgi:SAM-dependent methyltransferase
MTMNRDHAYWDGRYATDEYVFGTEPNAFLKRNAGRIPPGSRVLCIADGEARNGVFLAGQGHRVTSQDFSPRAQEKAARLARERGVEMSFERSDITARAWEADAFDSVVGIFFQFLSPDARAEVFAGIARTVRPGGVVLIEGYGEKQLAYGTGGPKVLENLYSETLLLDAFAAFSEVEVTAYDADVAEGSGHKGQSALVDMVGRK